MGGGGSTTRGAGPDPPAGLPRLPGRLGTSTPRQWRDARERRGGRACAPASGDGGGFVARGRRALGGWRGGGGGFVPGDGSCWERMESARVDAMHVQMLMHDFFLSRVINYVLGNVGKGVRRDQIQNARL